MVRLAIVYNESAGKGSGTKQAIQDAFKSYNHDLDFIDIGHLKSFAQHDILIAAGGDGTVNAVAQAAVKHKKPMGVLPVGTLNHFAKDLGLPIDLAEAAAIINQGKLTKIDYCTVNNKVFVNNSSIGLYPGTVLRREKLAPKFGKWPAALVATLQAAVRLSSTHLTFVLANKQYVFKTPLVFIGNNSYRFEKVGFTNRTSLSGGKLFIYVVRANRLSSLVRLVALGFLGKRHKHKDFLNEKQTELCIQSRKKVLDVAVDGEVISLKPPLEYKIHPAGLSVYRK